MALNKHIAAAPIILVFFAAGNGAALQIAAASPLEPHEALADFQLPAGYRIELVAAEPEVIDPIAIAFDESGRLWVVEMRDYPTLPRDARPSSRIRILEDMDGDGRYETASTFADNLIFPTGLQPWRGGVIVTLSGEIAYFPDDDRDNRADRRDVWYRGFAVGNEQLRANHPTLAQDGWVYVAGGLRGGTIRNLRLPGSREISINGRDFAFHPVTGECRSISGNGQFGLTFDDFGRRFTCSNRNPLMQVMIEQRYLERNPAYIMPQVVHDVAAAGADSRLYPRTRALTTSLQHAGQFTAACGVEIARGDALPPDAQGNAFICEPTANLVHREALCQAGAAFTSRSVEDGAEFLSATDEWFRPVNLYTGPDGALYVVDMYRAVIEHPEWMPEPWRDRPDMRDGADRGRIYRIVAEEAGRRAIDELKIDARNPVELAAALTHSNSWHRETASRLLLEMEGSIPAAALIDLARQASSEIGRFHAIAVLEVHNALTEEVLLSALDDSSPRVREFALMLAERRLPGSPRIKEKVLSRADDCDPRVRYQATLSLSMLPAEEAFRALGKVLSQDVEDPWARKAAALAAREYADEILLQWLLPSEITATRKASIEHSQELVDAVVAGKNPMQVAGVLTAMEKLNAGDARRLFLTVAHSHLRQRQPLVTTLSALAKSHPSVHRYLHELFDNAGADLEDPHSSTADRIAAAELLRFDARLQALEPLLRAVETEANPDVQIAAISALDGRREARIAERLIACFASQLPSVRQASLDHLLTTTDSAAALLNSVAAEQVSIADVGATRAQWLLQHPDASVRELAAKVLGDPSGDRAAVISDYQAALTLDGNPRRGKQVFLTACSSCHRISGEGTAIGPDIGDSAMKPSEQLLTDILDPNRAIDANYISYTALTVDGVAHQGIITSETASGVVLLTAEGKSIAVLREDLESLTGAGSLMPEGLERQISVRAMADLIAFLKKWRQDAPTTAEP